MPSQSQNPSSPRIRRYAPVLPDIADWPIYRLSQRRLAIIDEVIAEVMRDYADQPPQARINAIADAYFQERKRMKEMPWKVDPKDEKAFWGRIKGRLQHIAGQQGNDRSDPDTLMREIVTRYAHEVAGDFRPGTYNFARRVLGFFFTRIFNAATEGLLKSLFRSSNDLQAKMKLLGETEALRNLATKGTILLVPTHFSNLDSVVVGWAVQTLGLPALTYGAGINLFGHPVLSHFMSRLGAFRVDRRKKNHIYLETLKVYTEYLLRNNGHMLFFPGGTRSRGGNIETRLKLGLLGTAIEAQRKLILQNPEKPPKLFVVPLVIGYHTVLEAPSLIDEYLKQEGRERYVLVKDDFRSLRKNMRFIWNFFKSPSEMVFSFGAPMDLFGNPLDEEGNSLDKFGRPIDLSTYFRTNGTLNDDPQRNHAYTRMLGDEILKRFYRENVVFSSHLVAFAAMQLLLRRTKGDIYKLLTISEEGLSIDADEFYKTLERLHIRLLDLERLGRLRLADHMRTDVRRIAEHGITNLGVFHVRKPLAWNDKQQLITEDTRLLYFYHNRMKGYDLAKYI